MWQLFQPGHLFFILVIVFIFFRLDVPYLGRDLGRRMAHFRGQWSDLRGALFMAKGVDPAVGRDVGDMLPDEETARSRSWFLCLLAFLIGNTMYLFLSPLLPAAHRAS